MDVASDVFSGSNQEFGRKGSVQRRLQRWGYPNRKTLILVHSPMDDTTVESYRDLGRNANFEVIPVSFDPLSRYFRYYLKHL